MPSVLDLPDLTGKIVLVVDDNADHLELLTLYFRMCRASVVGARAADSALGLLRTAKFDLLVADIAMPGKDGIDLIRAVRSSDGPERTIPAVALTGFYEAYERNPHIAGFDGFIQKPVNPDMLSKLVRNVLRPAS